MNSTEIRHYLHQHPEISGNETHTQQFILQQIEKRKPDEMYLFERGGIIARFGEKKTFTIRFRAELDALPIQQISTKPYRSTHDEVSHVCGHDGHMAILIDLIDRWKHQPIDEIALEVLFQPAEETGKGAKSMMEDPLYYPADYTFALHNIPGYPLGELLFKKGVFSAAVESIAIELTGRESHAAEPEKGISCDEALVDIIEFMRSEDVRRQNVITTPIFINMGKKAYGTLAARGEIHYTFRAFDQTKLNTFKRDLADKLHQLQSNYGLETQISWIEPFAAVENTSEALTLVVDTAQKNELPFRWLEEPFRWGEDFGVFSQATKTAMIGIGSGESCPVLHDPHYDFPDKLIPIASDLWMKLCKTIAHDFNLSY